MIRLINYKKGFRIVSIALDKHTKEDLAEDKIDFLYVSDGKVELYPEGERLEADARVFDELTRCNNYDVFELWDNGALYKCYDHSSIENYFFVTGKCNSNCIMCPSSDFSRRRAGEANIQKLIEIARHIPTSVRHMTITGGEPFMAGEEIFELFKFLNDKYDLTEFLILTNGRIFSVDRYVLKFSETMPRYSLVGIPLHGSTPAKHDAITRSENSFIQTVIGLKKLLALKVPIELRLVVCDLNINDFENMAEMICRDFPTVSHVSIMAVEMTGNARKNAKEVWIPYSWAFNKIAPAVKYLINNGINVKLYNFPLCTVWREFWLLCEKSISTEKVRFAEVCKVCNYSSSCGGVFAGTFSLEKNDLRAVL